MNPYAILGVLLAFAGLGTWAVWERGSAEHWKAQYQTLQALYKTAAVAAETHAQAIQAKQTADLQRQSAIAIQQAQTQANNAQSQLRAYQAKLAAAATVKDLGHRCAGVEIPKDLVPE